MGTPDAAGVQGWSGSAALPPPCKQQAANPAHPPPASTPVLGVAGVPSVPSSSSRPPSAPLLRVPGGRGVGCPTVISLPWCSSRRCCSMAGPEPEARPRPSAPGSTSPNPPPATASAVAAEGLQPLSRAARWFSLSSSCSRSAAASDSTRCRASGGARASAASADPA